MVALKFRRDPLLSCDPLRTVKAAGTDFKWRDARSLTALWKELLVATFVRETKLPPIDLLTRQ